jgi:hypothetical protein
MSEWADMFSALGDAYWTPLGSVIIQITGFYLALASFVFLLDFGVSAAVPRIPASRAPRIVSRTLRVRTPYTFTPTKTGGLAPFNWGITGFWIGIFPDPSTGVFSGSSPVTGTYSVLFGVSDATNTAIARR